MNLATPHATAKVQDWARHKRYEWVACGINKHMSEIDSEVFDLTRRNTNAVESSHNKMNATGKRQALLAAVLL
jgi:hypothetical protein